MNISIFDVANVILGVSLVLSLFRLARGPSLPDRVVALELTSMLTVGIVLVQVAAGATSLLVDVAVIIALVGFLGTLTFAYYLEQDTHG